MPAGPHGQTGRGVCMKGAHATALVVTMGRDVITGTGTVG